jgi:hypothetical protein
VSSQNLYQPWPDSYPTTTTPTYYWPTTTYVTTGTQADRLRFALELIADLDDVDQIHKIVAKALNAK